MQTSRSPTSTPSARSSGSSARLTTQRGSGYIEMQVDKSDLARLSRALGAFEKKLAARIASDALKKWGKAVRDKARAYAYPGAQRTKRQLTYKVKRYKNAIWCGVGVRSERVKNTPRDQRLGRRSPFVGWKSHFMEVGWRPWPKGVSGNAERTEEIIRNERLGWKAEKVQITVYRNGKPHVRTIRARARTLSEGTRGSGGRAWRKGVRGRYGANLSRYATHYLYKAGMYGRSIAREYIVDAIDKAIADTRRTA